MFLLTKASCILNVKKMPCLVESFNTLAGLSFSESCKNIDMGALTPVKQADIIILLLYMGNL